MITVSCFYNENTNQFRMNHGKAIVRDAASIQEAENILIEWASGEGWTLDFDEKGNCVLVNLDGNIGWASGESSIDCGDCRIVISKGEAKKFRTSVFFHENTSKYNDGKAYIVKEFSTLAAAFNQLIGFACDRDKYFFASDNLSYFSSEQIRTFNNEECGIEFSEQVLTDNFNVDWVATEKAGIYMAQPGRGILICEDLDRFIDCGDYDIKIEEV